MQMDKNELIKKLEDIEWEDFEVKEAKDEIPKTSWETVSAFSNTAGGWIIFGVRKIEFFNPGALPKDLKYILKQDFSQPRNATIAHILRIIRLSENIGSGFHKMINGWKSHYKIEPNIEGDFNYYKITFPFGEFMPKTEYEGIKVGDKVGVKVGDKVGVKLTLNQQKIINNILQNKYLSAAELSTIVGISGRKIEENLKKLKEKGKIKRIGPDKGGHWEVIR